MLRGLVRHNSTLLPAFLFGCVVYASATGANVIVNVKKCVKTVHTKKGKQYICTIQ